MNIDWKGNPTAGTADVLVIDDEQSICEGCHQTLEADGYRTTTAPDGRKGLELIETMHPKVVVVDLKMPGITGMEVLAEVSKIDPTIVTIVITGYGSVESAVESMKVGAFDYLTKPFGPEQLLESVKRGMELSEKRKALSPPSVAVDAGTAVEGAAMDQQTVALKGLELLGQYYSLGLDKRDFLDELAHLETEARFHAETLGRIKEREKTLHEVLQNLRVVDEVIAQYEYSKSAVLQVMLEVQRRLNWLPRHALKWISRRLKVSLGRLYTIANFYEALSLEPSGAYLVEICTGTACHVRGAARLNITVSALLGIQPGQTDSDMMFTLKNVHCLGCCALAPVMKIGQRYYSNPTMKELEGIFGSLRQEKQDHATLEVAS
jgi:NADH-quinone oxidoreductase subunit E